MKFPKRVLPVNDLIAISHLVPPCIEPSFIESEDITGIIGISPEPICAIV